MSVVSRRQREKEQRRKDIIEAAEKLFFKKGYDNVSMNDIAKEVELSKATLYLYFDNKEALFFLIILRGARILSNMIKERMESEETGIGKLTAFREAYADFVNEYSDYFKIYSYFHSGRFDLESLVNNAYLSEFLERRQYSMATSSFMIPTPSVNEYAIRILDLGKEIFDICCNAVKMGLVDGSIQYDVDPVELTTLLIILSESMANMRPDLVKELEVNGISQQEFTKDVGYLLGDMIRFKYPIISRDEK
ncbi:MAG: DNA-binding transcriptional regulator EnvR [Methanobacterium sp. PtaU1.Bin242]|nr:MAG: DNA-binding transcriptional regulator EnvR [Methanobacterium sp. PtaU1.Bin242]